jgi:tetratricopeptide (TPR) repeat protein
LHAKAILHVDKAIDLDNNFYDAYLLKAEILRFFGVYAEAIQYYNRFLVEYPSDIVALYGLGICAFATGLKEGVVYFSEWIRAQYDQILGEPVHILDIGWKESFPITIEPKEDGVIVSVGDYKFPVERRKLGSYIFIMALPDELGNLKSVVGKLYEDKGEYKRVLREIRQRVNLKLTDDRYQDVNEIIQVNIEERDYYSYIEMAFGDFHIAGVTDPTNKVGLYGFAEGFAKNKQVELWLGTSRFLKNGDSKSEITTISPIKRVNIKFLDEEGRSSAEQKNLKRHKNLVPEMINVAFELKVTAVTSSEKGPKGRRR